MTLRRDYAGITQGLRRRYAGITQAFFCCFYVIRLFVRLFIRLFFLLNVQVFRRMFEKATNLFI